MLRVLLKTCEDHLFLLFLILAGTAAIFSGVNFELSGWSGDKRDQSMSETHIIVVGGGLAGLSASIEAYRQGQSRNVRVTLIEGEKGVGGNSAKATSGINGAPSYAQKLKNIKDSETDFAKDTLGSGDDLNVHTLVQVLTSKSAEAVSWVHDFDLDISDVRQLGGHSIPRTHRQPPSADGKIAPIGWNIIKALKTYVEAESASSDKIKIMTSTKVNKLITRKSDDDILVTGVQIVDSEGKESIITADAVILTTGGYGCDHTSDSLLKKYAPLKADLPTTNGVFAVGSGVKMGLEAGASVIHMDKVQVHPTGLVDPANPAAKTKFLGPEVLRGCGGLLINQQGERFCNELGRRDYVTKQIMENCSKHAEADIVVAYLVLNEEAAENFGKGTLGFYASKGFFKEYASAKDFEIAIGSPSGSIGKSFSQYSDAIANGKDGFGKVAFPVSFSDNEKLCKLCTYRRLDYCKD